MTTLIEKSILNERLEKSRSGTYADTSENRRKHRVGQKYGAEKQPEDDEKAEKKEADPEKELEAVNKVIAAINEGKLNLPAAEVMKLSEKKQKLEDEKKQAEKINAGVKANEEKINEAQKKEKGSDKKINEASKRKKYGDMNVEEAKKELLGKDLTITDIETGKTRTEKITSILEGNVRGHETVMARVEGGGTYPIKQINTGKAWKAWKYEIEFNDSKSEEPKQEASGQASEADKEDLREARKKLAYLQDNEERLIKRDGKEKYEERLKQAKDEVAKLKGEKPKEENKPEPKKEETEESYTRVKFEDVPNSGKVNLKKYLSDKVRNQADENLGVLSKVSFENLQTMEKGLVKEFNSQFGSLSKSRRAEKLYSIMKVKSELENRKQEESKKYQKYTSSLDDNTLLSIGYDLGEEIRKLSSRGFSTLEQQQEVLKKISELSGKRQINEDEQRKRMDKLNNLPDETRANKKGELAKRGNESQKKE